MEKEGENVKELRIEANLTQQKVAEMLGCSKSFVCQLERGVKKPNLSTIKRLAEIYNVPISKILSKLGFCIKNRCITIYDKKTKEVVADIGESDIILHNDYEAEIYYE